MSANELRSCLNFLSATHVSKCELEREFRSQILGWHSQIWFCSQKLCQHCLLTELTLETHPQTL